jgi:hypothetical protein
LPSKPNAPLSGQRRATRAGGPLQREVRRHLIRRRSSARATA